MAKDKISDYSQTATNNTDVGGVSIIDTASAANIQPAYQELMSHLADMDKGTAPLSDTFSVADPTDRTKKARLDAGNVGSGVERVLDAEALYRSGAPTITRHTSSGTHTFQTKTRFFQIEAVGGGGGGAGTSGLSGGGGAGGGGNSGFCGITNVLTRGAIATGTVTIGAAGTGGVGSSNGTHGGDTSWSDGTNSFTWPGGKRCNSVSATAFFPTGEPPANDDHTGTIYGGSLLGHPGNIRNATGNPQMRGGAGGSSKFGTGGAASTAISSTGSPGENAKGYGSGGSGASSTDNGANRNGGNGSPGLLIVYEW